jgi:preprotein translocase subunit SecF
MQILRNPNYDFLKWRWHALVLSTVIVVAGLALILARGLPLGIDFSGGTIVIVQFAEPVTEDAVRNAVGGIAGEKVVQQYGDRAANEVLIRLPLPGIEEQGFELERGQREVIASLEEAALPSFEVLQTELVGPVIGADLQRKGIYATITALLGILAYIALRFRFTFGIGAVVAALHDILVTVAFLTFFGYELSLNVVAALLTITGYSVNDTIVVFDRVRENLRSMRRDSLEHVVNLSVNQTLARTIITAGTTFFAVLALYVFGGQVLRGFAFTLLVGVVAGTYSTVFIASAISIVLSNRQAKRPASRTAPAGTPVEPGDAASPARKKPARKVRAS